MEQILFSDMNGRIVEKNEKNQYCCHLYQQIYGQDKFNEVKSTAQ